MNFVPLQPLGSRESPSITKNIWPIVHAPERGLPVYTPPMQIPGSALFHFIAYFSLEGNKTMQAAKLAVYHIFLLFFHYSLDC